MYKITQEQLDFIANNLAELKYREVYQSINILTTLPKCENEGCDKQKCEKEPITPKTK